MADSRTALRWMSERGNPVGAEELIERIEASLAGDPLVVVAQQPGGPAMTKTRELPTTNMPNRPRGPAWALAAFVAVIALGALLFIFDRRGEPVVDTAPPTTVAPEPPTTLEATGDLAVIESAVAAYYSGDVDRAAELFELPDRSDEEIRSDSAYQAAVDGRLELSCTELANDPGRFSCTVPYHNALTDAIDYRDSGDTNWVRVEDGVVTEFGFPEHTFIVGGIGSVLAVEDRFDGYEHCTFGPFPEACAAIQLANVDEWVDWEDTVEPETVVRTALESWYGDDCARARHLSFNEAHLCGTGGRLNQMIEYESILGAAVSLNGCEAVEIPVPEIGGLACEVSYSNVMNAAVEKGPAVIDKQFEYNIAQHILGSNGEPWWESDYPEDAELRESFGRFARSGDLNDEFTAGFCITARTSRCAQLIVDNLEGWAAWYQANG